jgi:hypothetical protein
VGVGVVIAVPATVAVKVTIWPNTAVDGEIVRVDAVGSVTGEILAK